VYTPPAPPPEQRPEVVAQSTVESIAENMIETDEVPDVTVVNEPIHAAADVVPEYLSMSKISVLPVFSERDIMRDVVYPPIALRSNIEGIVYLELFVDKEGLVRRVTILREDPPDRGFGEAAAKAFENRRGTPAMANGEAVAVRYRYPVRFTIKR
jgi:protein TonB